MFNLFQGVDHHAESADVPFFTVSINCSGMESSLFSCFSGEFEVFSCPSQVSAQVFCVSAFVLTSTHPDTGDGYMLEYNEMTYSGTHSAPTKSLGYNYGSVTPTQVIMTASEQSTSIQLFIAVFSVVGAVSLPLE